MSNTRLYVIWVHMKARCYSANSKDYRNYGGRGITICDEWFNNFTAFYNWAISNGYSEELSIDRIDVNGNYEPSNCRWATVKEQANNTRKNHYVTYNGETKTVAQWAEILGMKQMTLTMRLRRGWSVESAFTTPTKKER